MRCHADSFVTAPPILTYDKNVQLISPYSQANRDRSLSACLTDTSPGRVDDDTLIACVNKSLKESSLQAASPPTRQYHRYLSNLKNIPNNDYLVGNGCLREGLQSPYIPIDGSSTSPLTTLAGFMVLAVLGQRPKPLL